MEKLLVFYNESSGQDEGEKLANWFQDYTKKKRPELKVYLTKTGPSVKHATLVKKAEEHQVDTLIIIGGDGTIHHIVQAFQEKLDHYQVGLLPGGTVNNLARVLGIPLDKEEAAKIILDGQIRKIDYGKVNDEVIISTLTIGILADTAVWISQKEKQRYGSWIFIKRFVHLLLKKKKYHLDIKTEKEHWKGKTQLLTVTMSNSVGGYTNFDDSASPDDGMFHVTIIPSLDIFRFVFYLPRIIKGKIYSVPGINYLTASQINIQAREKNVGTRTDGDATDDLPIELVVVPKGLAVFAPQEKE
ncbi:diacylglycerol/lipid kinase family protein [Enterococcus villorum]|uniref:Diacylglycerol kinase n=2 Tax=Enterococcus villorum TaxID=112904 RepID=A0A511IZ81_9ENTE|nr:diacylglycerol kinase family protein [Enterococcus villorum]EOH87388.1 YegS//BmrU family lipid kinase [Enterococcus villorum ATCC 700913]EOW77893.1 diacylglycerol kinase catalytic subunit [Enterococcus villorum ATCC 700913]GEL91067.1 diacylglycerol kinase [Enterococcus villorum]